MLEQTWAIIADYQYYENYGAHDWDGRGECPQYWKAKGGHQVVVAQGLTSEEIAVIDLFDAVRENMPENDYYNRYTLLDYKAVALDDYTVDQVHKHLLNREFGSDFQYARFDFDNDFVFEWAVAHLIEQGKLTLSHEKTCWARTYEVQPLTSIAEQIRTDWEEVGYSLEEFLAQGARS